MEHILETIADAVARADDNRRGQVIADLAIITLLIDAGITTIDQACERLELIQSSITDSYDTDKVKQRTQILTQWLRDREKPERTGWIPTVINGGKEED